MIILFLSLKIIKTNIKLILGHKNCYFNNKILKLRNLINKMILNYKRIINFLKNNLVEDKIQILKLIYKKPNNINNF